MEIEEKAKRKKAEKLRKQQEILHYQNIEELSSSPNYQQLFYDLLGYDPTDTTTCDSLRHFMPAVQQSQCLFAKKSRVWGSPNWDNTKRYFVRVADFISCNNDVIIRYYDTYMK